MAAFVSEFMSCPRKQQPEMEILEQAVSNGYNNVLLKIRFTCWQYMFVAPELNRHMAKILPQKALLGSTATHTILTGALLLLK